MDDDTLSACLSAFAATNQTMETKPQDGEKEQRFIPLEINRRPKHDDSDEESQQDDNLLSACLAEFGASNDQVMDSESDDGVDADDESQACSAGLWHCAIDWL